MSDCVTIDFCGPFYSELVWPACYKTDGTFNDQMKRNMERKKSKRIRWVNVRFTPEEYQKLEQQFHRTTSRKLSQYIRDSLFNRPMVTTYRNASLDDLMEEIGQLKDELNHIGNNYNQAVKKLHTLWRIEDFKTWIDLNEKDKAVLFQKIDTIEDHLQKMVAAWLQ